MSPASSAGSNSASHYDRVTIAFHWLTAALVVLLFGSAWVWNNAPRDLHWRQPLEGLHVSLGILFAAVLIARMGWRVLRGRRLDAVAGLAGRLAQVVHFTLYLLLGQVALGFGVRWMQGEAFSFFGLFSVPSLFASDRALAHTLEGLHNYIGWSIVIIAGGHAAAALLHHFWARDRVLRRMVPLAGG